jgi:hypothetical protein
MTRKLGRLLGVAAFLSIIPFAEGCGDSGNGMAGSGNSCGALKVCVDRSCIDAYLEAKDVLLAHRAHVEGPIARY